MTETIGPLRARVRLESPTRTVDDLGGAALGWVDEGEVWAAIDARGVALSAAYDGLAPSPARALRCGRAWMCAPVGA